MRQSYSVAFSPDGRTLASGGVSRDVGGSGRNGTIRLWDVRTAETFADVAYPRWGPSP